jgi:hypothetical protein
MVMPGFTAEAASFSTLKENYYYYQFPTKTGVYIKQNAIPYTMNTLSNQWKIIPEPLKESSESGRRAWSALETACDNLQCEECRNDCLRFINGLHDAINIKLGKPMKTPNDFIYLRDFINEMSKHSFFDYKYW